MISLCLCMVCMYYLGRRTEPRGVSRSLFERSLFSEDIGDDGASDSGSETSSEFSGGEQLDEDMGGMYTELQLSGMFDLYAAQGELPMSPVRPREGFVVEVRSPARNSQKVLECMANSLTICSMSEADSVMVSSQNDVVRLSTVMDEHGHELPVVRVPSESVDLVEAGFGGQADGGIEELVLVGRRGIKQWARLAVKAKTLDGYESSFEEWNEFLERNRIFNPFLLGCEQEVQVCVLSAFLLNQYRLHSPNSE